MSANQLVISVGSTDWAGRTAPAGGVHTGSSIITMVDGSQYAVASNVAEVRRKLDLHAVAQTDPTWVAFDQALSSVPLVLNSANVASVT